MKTSCPINIKIWRQRTISKNKPHETPSKNETTGKIKWTWRSLYKSQHTSPGIKEQGWHRPEIWTAIPVP